MSEKPNTETEKTEKPSLVEPATDRQAAGNTISVQPGAPPPPGTTRRWMALPPTIPNCPPGLEYLTMVDKLFVNQQISLMEVMTGWEISNKYAIQNGVGEQVYFAYEESGCCERMCCKHQRGYTMHIVDNFNREVMRATRPFKCSCCTYSCCADTDSCGHETSIEAPPGNVIGVVRQRSGCYTNNYVVKDARDQTNILRINGPNRCCWYGCDCCGDRVFDVVTVQDGKKIGAVTKKFKGIAQEAFTNADLFSVEFPLDLDIHIKATLLGATFLIDFLEFEESHDNDRH